MSEKHWDYSFRAALIGGILCLLASQSLDKPAWTVHLSSWERLFLSLALCGLGLLLLLISLLLTIRTVVAATKRRRARSQNPEPTNETPPPGVWPPPPNQDSRE